MIKAFPYLSRAAFLAALLAIAWASLVPQETRPQTGFWDGWEHLAAYFVLALSGLIAFSDRKHRLLVIGGVIAYGIALEVAQGFLPGRIAGVVDALANSAGAILALLLLWLYERMTGQ